MHGLDAIDRDDCLALLRRGGLGRIAFSNGLHPVVVPVLFAMLDDDVVIRTGPGEKLVAAALHQTVAFEIDEHDPGARTGWSVLVVGPAEEVVHPDERARCDALGLEPWAGSARDRWVRIRSHEITGRRLHDSE
ncbi:MAG TPA: pyridoxamine 5'-phosphate oxidase family protein [Acidimicrobiia bacterium]|nr:pyridoxamine 5'-phosphate oxidase family protein [Acidimicrobiia bacterium]